MGSSHNVGISNKRLNYWSTTLVWPHPMALWSSATPLVTRKVKEVRWWRRKKLVRWEEEEEGKNPWRMWELEWRTGTLNSIKWMTDQLRVYPGNCLKLLWYVDWWCARNTYTYIYIYCTTLDIFPWVFSHHTRVQYPPLLKTAYWTHPCVVLDNCMYFLM